MNTYRIQHYLVKWGDTLPQIAQQFGIDLYTLKYLNNITNDDLYAGLALKIPVQTKNETFSSTAILRKDVSYFLNRHLKKKRYYRFYL